MMSLIRLTGVSKRYALDANEVAALDDVSLSVEGGERVAIVGASGSGKSTLLHLIGCLDTPTSGDYRLKGRNVSGLDGRGLAHIRNEEIGFVFQSFHLLPRSTALANVMQPLVYRGAPRAERRRLALAALARVGLADRAEHFPAQLSGGQRQRVAIARAVVTQPSILLADEPTGNLDSAATLQVMDLFDTLHYGRQTILIVTHDTDIAARCDRIVGLTDGRVVQDRRA
ncbi:MAG: ABC transporter ATP-binding protein [Gammaproteobacteria bacterium]|nr:ABC transporter ATP-binding protein [Gammaproteobacteria bacterium]